MEPSDYWTHLGLAVGLLATVVAPRMFNGDYATFTTIYIVGAAVVIAAATVFRFRSRAAAEPGATVESKPVDS
jgi:ribosomal protein L13